MVKVHYWGRKALFAFLLIFFAVFILFFILFILLAVQNYERQLTSLIGALGEAQSAGADPVNFLMHGVQGSDYEAGLSILKANGYQKSAAHIFRSFLTPEVCGLAAAGFCVMLAFIAGAWFYERNHRSFLATATQRVRQAWNSDAHTQMSVYYGDAACCKLLEEIDERSGIYQQSMRLLQAEQEKVYRFMEDISHQLKTPLTLMHIYMERIEFAGNEEFTVPVHSCKKQINKMNLLIRQLLKIGKFDAGQVQMHYDSHCVALFVESIINDLTEMAEKKQLKIDFVCPADLKLYFDEFWMQEAVENLLKNSIEHSPEQGQIMVCVKPERHGCCLLVTDEGCGIAPKDLEFVFDRFHTGDRQKDQSNGLGLTIAREILRCHFGTLEVHNNESGGVTFTVYLPVLHGKEAYNGS